MREWLVFAIGSVMAFGSISPAVFSAEAEAAPTLSRLLLSGHYQVRVDGEIVPDVKVYRARGVPRIVLEHDLLGGAVLITGGEKTVRSLASDAVTPADDVLEGILVDHAKTVGEPTTAIVESGIVTFKWKGLSVEVEGREPLLGEIRADDLLAALPEYRRARAEYAPGKGAIRLLNGQAAGLVEIEVFFGSWCPHCEQVLPRLLRVFDELDGEHYRLILHAVPRRFGSYAPAKAAAIEELPTAIIRKGGKVIARMTGRNWTKPETALAALLLEDLESGSPGKPSAP